LEKDDGEAEEEDDDEDGLLLSRSVCFIILVFFLWFRSIAGTKSVLSIRRMDFNRVDDVFYCALTASPESEGVRILTTLQI